MAKEKEEALVVQWGDLSPGMTGIIDGKGWVKVQGGMGVMLGSGVVDVIDPRTPVYVVDVQLKVKGK